MKINPSSSIRTTIYVASVFINAMVGVLLANDVSVPILVLGVIAGLNAVVALMAGANVNPGE